MIRKPKLTDDSLLRIKAAVDPEGRSPVFDGIVYRGSAPSKKDSGFFMDTERGSYFSGDIAHARGYGDAVYKCRVILNKPVVYTEVEALNDMEIDRNILIGQGYDGRIIQYDNGEVDVIAFYPEQITILEEV